MGIGVGLRCASAALVCVAALGLQPPPARSEDKLLSEEVDFAGTIAFLGMGVPGFVLAAVRNGETAFAGFGETATGSGTAPTADTLMRVGSLSKVFCGNTLASLISRHEIGLTDRLQDRLGDGFTVPEKDGHVIRIVDLVTHASGLPREAVQSFGPPDDPFGVNTPEVQKASLAGDPLLFAPGTGVRYSNYGFDLLGAALAEAGGKPYAELLQDRVLGPRGMKDTVFNPRPEDAGRLMQGHFFDGSVMPDVPTPQTIECAGGLYTTAADMTRWLTWQLDRAGSADAEVRLLDQAAYLYRDGLNPVAGLDDSGADMDAMGLGWVIMMPEGNRPLILAKSGGLQGMFAFVAMAPSRGIGVFAAINEFNVAGFFTMVETVNHLIEDLAPR